MLRAIVHNYDAAQKASAKTDPGKIPVLEYQDGKKVALLPHGQQVNLDRFTQGPRNMTGKAARKHRLAQRRLSRGEPITIVDVPPVRLEEPIRIRSEVVP